MKYVSPQCIFQILQGSFAFRGTASSNAGFSFQSEGMTTLTNLSPRVYHCAALSTYLPQAHTCTSVHVPHYITNNEVTPKEFSTKLSLSLLIPCLATQIFHFLPRVIIRARRSIPLHIIGASLSERATHLRYCCAKSSRYNYIYKERKQFF